MKARLVLRLPRSFVGEVRLPGTVLAEVELAGFVTIEGLARVLEHGQAVLEPAPTDVQQDTQAAARPRATAPQSRSRKTA